MTDYRVSFIVNGSKQTIDGLFGTLNKLKPQDLNVQPVVNPKSASTRESGKPAWQLIGEFLATKKIPVRPRDIGGFLETVGFTKAGVSSHLGVAVKNGVARKTAKGYLGAKK